LLTVLWVAVLLAGCLFTVNEPQVTPDGTVAVFLDGDGAYTLFPETGTLHLLCDGSWIDVPAASIEGSGGLLDLSPDGTEALFVEVQMADVFSPFESTLYRVALQPTAVPESIVQTQSSIAKAVWTRDDRILLLQFGEEDLGTLHALDPATGGIKLLAEDLLSFAAMPNTEELILLAADPRAGLPFGMVVRWNPGTDARETLATFVLSEETFESFTALPHRFFWDVSFDGGWLALALFDGMLFRPAVEEGMPDLYLIDVNLGEAERIAANALMPSFSPDGSALIYAVEDADGSGFLMWRSLTSERTVRVPGSEGMSTAFWLSPTKLGMTFESGEDRYRLVELDLETEAIRVLVNGAQDSAE